MATARITQQGVEVLYTEPAGTPKARLTQQGIEVIYVDSRKYLSANINPTAQVTADLDVLGGPARVTQQAIEVVYTDGIDPTARVTGHFIEVIHTTDTLSGNFTVDIAGQVVVTANLSLVGPKQLSVGFAGTGILYAALVPLLHPGNTLELTQTVTTTNILSHSASNTLTLTQDLPNGSGRAIPVSASSVLLFIQSAVGGKNLSPDPIEQTITFTQSVFESRPVSSILNLTQLLEGGIFYYSGIASNDLALTQSVDVDAKAQFVVDFNGTGQLQARLNRLGDTDITSTLFLNQLAVGTLLQEFMTLQSPFEGPETIITLPKPLVGNTENIVSDLLLKKSMNGVKRTYIKTNESRRLTYTFSMTRDKGLELENFFKLHNGHKMRLTTWEAEVWRVNLITNPLDFNQPRRGAVCGPQVEIDLEFEGVKLSG